MNRCRPATGLRMALLQIQMDVEVRTVAPDLARVAQAHDQLVQQHPPPSASRRRRWALTSGRSSRAPKAPLAGVLPQGGGACGSALDLRTSYPI